jgi:hypothetical protein
MYDIILGRSRSDQKKYGKKGTVLIGKQYVQMGQNYSLSNPIYLDVSRAHAFLIVGKRGCLTEETKIYTDKGYKKISEFKEKTDKIISVNRETLKYEWEKAKLISYEISKEEELYKIETFDGQILILTAEHPLLIHREKINQWIIASEIKKTDQLVSTYNLPEVNFKKNKETLRIARLLGFILGDGTINVRKGKYKDGKGCTYNGTKKRLILNSKSRSFLN